MKDNLCPGCGQPMLRKGQKRQNPFDYRHAKGCPLDRKRPTKKPLGKNRKARNGDTMTALEAMMREAQANWKRADEHARALERQAKAAREIAQGYRMTMMNLNTRMDAWARQFDK